MYTGKCIYSVSGWYGLDYWQRGQVMIDASLNKKARRYIRVFAKVNNFLNSHTIVELHQPDSGYSTGLLPGEESSRRITIMRKYDESVYYVGVQCNIL